MGIIIMNTNISGRWLTAFLVLSLFLIYLLIAGCADMSTTARVSETAWQTANIIDTGQTITVARHPDRFAEGGFPTRDLIGAHPTQRDVYIAMAAFAVMHYGVTRLLDERDPGSGTWHWMSLAWQSITLGAKISYVVDNYSRNDGAWK